MKKHIIATIILLCNLHYSNAQQGAYSLWYEFGNGTFVTKSFNSAADLNNFMLSSIPPLGNPGNTSGLKKVTPIYKPDGPSLSKPFSIRNTDIPTTVSVINNTLASGTNLGMQTSTHDFLSKDTILCALQYKSNSNANKKIAFFYNSNTNAAFDAIPSTNKTIQLVSENSSLMQPSNQIRTHHNEIAKIADQAIMNRAGQGYLNGLVFDLDPSSKTENCIFLTLTTLSRIALDNDETFKLVFLDSNNNVLQQQNNSMTNHKNLPSHDPNYEKVIPACIEFHDGGGKIVHYNVHFQNTGPGAAHYVETTTTLPAGYTILDIQNRQNLNWSIAKVTRSAGYILDMSASHDDKLILKFTEAQSSTRILNGTLNNPNPLEDITTMGDFEFDMQLKNLLPGPDDLISSTSIIFDLNEPVITNDAVIRIRKCCSCKEKESKDHGHTKPTKCNSKSRFLRWLLCEDC